MAWAHWPFLPVVRRTRGREELGVVFDARAAQLTGFSATVFFSLCGAPHKVRACESIGICAERFWTAEK